MRVKPSVAARRTLPLAVLPALVLGVAAFAMALAGPGRNAARDDLYVIAGAATVLLALGALAAVVIARKVKRAEDALEREKELAEVTLGAIGDGVITTDAEGRVDFLNAAAQASTGWRGEEARQRKLADVFRVVHERTGLAVDPLTDAAGDDARQAGNPVLLVDRAGGTRPIRYSHAPIHGRDGRRVGSVLVFHDVSALRAMAEQRVWQATHDASTGLANRREFERRLEALAAAARSEGRRHVLVCLELEPLEAVNDGSDPGAREELLRQLTALMRTRMRDSDTLARLGGDEFGVLLQDCPMDQAVRIANGLRETVREFRFVWRGKSCGVGMSAGLVAIDALSEDDARLLALARAACGEAKHRGPDAVHVHRPERAGEAGRSSKPQLASQINQALVSGRFRLYRQAIVPLQGACGGRRHYEVLVRMMDANGALVPPTAFIPAAERYNLLTSIERWVVSSLLDHLHRLWQAGEVPADLEECSYYAVNISGASLNDTSFPDFLREQLARYALPAGLVCFEITETTAIANLSKAAELMHAFKALGCRFSLDDFGTGMSSFAYLKYLPADTLKIAGMFVKDMARDAMDAEIVAAIHRVSHVLGMQTVAESVEDAATLEAVRRLGIDFAQGYHIAEPEALQSAARPAGAPRERT